MSRLLTNSIATPFGECALRKLDVLVVPHAVNAIDDRTTMTAATPFLDAGNIYDIRVRASRPA
jgi:hypothetical protein